MGTSRTIAVVGLRTVPRAGWRADAASALSFVRTRPDAWVLGILGTTLRGTIVLLTLPIVVLPTQVEARMALGANIGSTGLADGFWSLVGAATAVTVAVLVGVLYLLARVEHDCYSRLMSDRASSEQRAWNPAVAPTSKARSLLIARLFAVQAAGALMILASAVPLATAVRDRLMAELLAPSSTAPLYERIATQLTREAFLVVVVVVVVELVTVYASRALLGHAYGLAARASRPGSSPGIVVRGVARAVLVKPARTLSNAALGWALFVGALLAGTALVGFAWQAVRAVFLAGSWSDRLEQAIALLGAAALLAACFAAALLALGLVSALRAALSSLASLR